MISVDPINLTGLYPQAYEHPDDAAALGVLERTPGLGLLISKVNAWGIDRFSRIELTGSSLHVTAESFPELWKLLLTAKERISLPFTPELYITGGEEINAYTTGVEKPIIVLNRGAVDHLDEDELLFVIAHEMGHIKSSHVLYYQMASYIPLIGGMFAEMTLGASNFFTKSLQIALLHWQRAAELTSDRAGLLGVQDKEVAIRALMKLAGMPEKYAGKSNLAAFIQQAREFESFDVSITDKVAKFVSISTIDHPWTVLRAKELIGWMDSGGYDRVLKLPYPLKVAPKLQKIFCDQCGHEASSADSFCKKCGHQLQPPAGNAAPLPQGK